MTAADAQRHVS